MKRFPLILLALLLAAALPSAGRGLPRYPFLKMEQNVLQYPSGRSPEMEGFFNKLDTLLSTGGADVRILHVGGSHVQGGSWTDRMRRNFLSLRYGLDGGRGLVFPFSIASTNTPSGYSSSCAGRWEYATCLKPGDLQIGLTGMAAVALDTTARAVIDLLPKEPQILQQRYTFNKVDIIGTGEMEPVLLLGPKDTLRGVVGRNVCHFDLPHYTDWLQLAFRGKGTYTLRGIYLDKPGGGFTYVEAGVNGASTRSWAQCDLWEQDLHRVHPDLVIFSIGINDIQGNEFESNRFKAHYRTLIKQVRRVNPRCAILFTGINDSWRKRNPNPLTIAAEEAFRELAKEYNAVFWDWFEVMGGFGSMATWQEAGLAQSDKVHCTQAGYRLVGDLLFEAIMDSYYLSR